MQHLENIQVIPATLDDYSVIQNMARFYVYDISRFCGFTPGWECPADGLFECFDFKKYFEEPTRWPYLIKVGDELAGFVLVNRVGTLITTDWNIAEFFVLAKFQGKNVARQVAIEIWNKFAGNWEVSVIPKNIPALKFWRKIISSYTNHNYTEEIKTVTYDKHQSNRFIFSFNNINLLRNREL